MMTSVQDRSVFSGSGGSSEEPLAEEPVRLPYGLQIVGRFGADEQLLRTAGRVEAALARVLTGAAGEAMGDASLQPRQLQRYAAVAALHTRHT
jgi:hypothetical protein